MKLFVTITAIHLLQSGNIIKKRINTLTIDSDDELDPKENKSTAHYLLRKTFSELIPSMKKPDLNIVPDLA